MGQWKRETLRQRGKYGGKESLGGLKSGSDRVGGAPWSQEQIGPAPPGGKCCSSYLEPGLPALLLWPPRHFSLGEGGEDSPAQGPEKVCFSKKLSSILVSLGKVPHSLSTWFSHLSSKY